MDMIGKNILLCFFAGVMVCSCIGCGRAKYAGENENTTNAAKEAKMDSQVIAEAKYPHMSPCPKEESFLKEDGQLDVDGYQKAYDAWEKDSVSLETEISDDTKKVQAGFLRQTLPVFLKTKNDDENKVYSPLNLYIALSMLTEVTDTNSSAQLLDLLGQKDKEKLREDVTSLWRANYREDGLITSLLANSMWLDKDIAYQQDTMKLLAKKYYASSYQGEMGSEELNKLYRKWINDNTGNLLEKQVEGLSLDPAAILSLVSAIYYKAPWEKEFNAKQNTEDTFYGKNKEMTCTFMHKNEERIYYWGDDFSAIKYPFTQGGYMWLILPKEESSADKLIQEKELTSLLSKGDEDWEHSKNARVHLSMPKFDVSSDMDLTEGLQSLGVTDIFDENKSDFSPLTQEETAVKVSTAMQAARVKADETGCEAAAYTTMSMIATAMPPEELEDIEFNLNRPFVFAVVSASGQNLFTGVVNRPGE